MAGDTVITVVGNLTGDPELRFTPSGAAVANFTVASTPRSFDKQSNEWKDSDTLFMRCSVWREAAENVAESLTKGMRVIVQGRLAPDGAAHEQRVAVLPFVALLVETARGGRDGEVRDRRPRWGEAQLGVAREVPDHRDDGVTSHASSSCVL